MKGVILAGGFGTRLSPLTKISNKHLLPVYDKPMIYYPIKTLVDSGVTDIMLVVSGTHSGSFIPILKNGTELGIKRLSYAYQEKPDGGIADALELARNFAGGNNIVVMLGDNVTDANIKADIKDFNNFTSQAIGPAAHIFTKHSDTPQRFGTIDWNEDGTTVKRIIEKPVEPPSNDIVTGVYMYDSNVFKFIDRCEVSDRGELEISEINNLYIEHGTLRSSPLDGDFWSDAGTFESLHTAGTWARNNANKSF